jgi:hypothetical protein
MKTQYNYTNLIPDLKAFLTEGERLHDILSVPLSIQSELYHFIAGLTKQQKQELIELQQLIMLRSPFRALTERFEELDDILTEDNEEGEEIPSAVSIIKGEAFDIINNFLKNIHNNTVYQRAENYFVKHPIKYFENNLLVIKNTKASFDFNFQVLKDLVREIEEGLLAKLFDQDEEYFRTKFLTEKKEIILQKLADYEAESEVDSEERAEWDRADMLRMEELD